MLDFLRSRQWIVARRLALIAIIVILGVRQYGNSIVSMLRRPNPTRDIVLTRTEFRPELPGTKPGWIIGFRNNSDKFTYDQIQLEATYMDDQGKVLEKDKLVVKQKLPPGDEKLIGSADFKSRGAAKSGTLKVTGAEQVK
jgi:hypothetical protein